MNLSDDDDNRPNHKTPLSNHHYFLSPNTSPERGRSTSTPLKCTATGETVKFGDVSFASRILSPSDLGLSPIAETHSFQSLTERIRKMNIFESNNNNEDEIPVKTKKKNTSRKQDKKQKNAVSSSESQKQLKSQAKKASKKNSPKVLKIGRCRKLISPLLRRKKSKKTQEEDATCDTEVPATKSTTPPPKEPKPVRSPKLQTAARARVWQHRESVRKQKQEESENLKQKEIEEQKRREEEEMAKLRKETVFKAQPIRKYAPLPKPLKRNLTLPHTPNFAKRRRVTNKSKE